VHSCDSILDAIIPTMEITTAVRALLEHKNRELWTTTPTATVFEAIQRMADKGIGALPVVEDSRLVGIISERDYLRKVALKGRSSKDTAVSEIMTRELVTVVPEQSVAECMNIVTQFRVRHLPVVEAGRLVNIISIGDLVRWIIATQRMTIEQLEKYIVGSYPG
jgi:CBS domain-containing protein